MACSDSAGQDPKKLVGGHLTLWTPGQLIYNLVRAGLDCSGAELFVEGYDISVLVRNIIVMPHQAVNDANGDLEALSRFFPKAVFQYCDADLGHA